jgi:hypothetical protein
VADALSRKPHTSDVMDYVQCLALSTCQPKWLEEITANYQSDSEVHDIITKLSLNAEVIPYFTCIMGFFITSQEYGWAI